MKKFPLTSTQLEELTRDFPTPFHLYDETAIRATARRLNRAFGDVPGFREFFAVKACPNPFILKILRDEGFGADCSSLPELMLAEMVGITGERIMFTSNDTPAEEFRYGRRLGAILNLDDISHIPFLEQTAGIPELVCLRYNPGPLREGNVIIGKPEEAKYGFTREQLFAGYASLRQRGAKRFGLHTMVASNELNPDYFVGTAGMLAELAVELKRKLEIAVEFLNIGGGIGIPYRPDQEPVDLERIAAGVRDVYRTILAPSQLDQTSLYMECGRMITGPYGWLVSRVRHIKKTYKNYVGLDACMANLMRPALYGAYHHITVPAKDDQPAVVTYDVTGSLCENNDKFAIDRKLPELEPGDLLVIHDTGAHGHAMGFQYNGKLRSAELLLRCDGTILPIRRAETVEDYFATLDSDAVRTFRP
ncbi:MAG: diaminopimelate decarboxylase [Planctomycetia bacterium]|nr:diaminopimelate decarboxylase [Planctomycetia bacterium]